MNSPAPQSQTAPDYLTAFGLQQAPYLDAHDTRFFYADPALTQRLDLLQHLTQFGDNLLGVIGPAGSGKSTLAQQFLLRGNTLWRSCRINGAQTDQPAQLLAKLAECFGLQATATPERLKADLVRHCQTLRHNSQLAVIVVDDTQQLPEPALKTLLELAGTPRETLKLLRIILFSEPGLEQRLTQAGLHSPLQPLLHSLDIPRFDDQQTAAYLMYRLAVAGYSGESPFSLTEIRALHKAAGGLPGKLNVLAHETLIERAGRMTTRKQAAAMPALRIKPVVVLGLAGSLVVMGLAWYLSQNQTSQEPLPPQAMAPSTAPHATPGDAASTATTEPTLSAAEESKKSLETTPEITQQTDTQKQIDKAQGAAPALPAGTPAVTAATQSTPPITAEPSPALAPPDTAPVTAPPPSSPTAGIPAPETAPQASAPTMGSPVPPLAATPTETPAKPAPDAASKAETPPTTPPVPVEKPQPAPAPEIKPQVAPPKAPTAVTQTGQLGTGWLNTRPASHFTLQLLGGRSEKSLRDYLSQHQIPEPVATFHTLHKGDDWYVLVHGEFPSMAAAQQAVATLPTTVRRGKPWPRSFASIHEAMRQ